MKATNSQVIKQQVVYLPVKDLARAQKFYADIFDFDVRAFSYIEYLSGEKWSIFPLTKLDTTGQQIPTGFLSLGLGCSPHLIPSHEGTLVFLPCDDIDAVLFKVEKHGGQILQGKTKDPYKSSDKKQDVILQHAFFSDTEGNKVGLTYCKILTTIST
ncbi:MAG: VOC family protein [Bacteroidota bacterium]